MKTVYTVTWGEPHHKQDCPTKTEALYIASRLLNDGDTVTISKKQE